jgi:hypothetical protein
MIEEAEEEGLKGFVAFLDSKRTARHPFRVYVIPSVATKNLSFASILHVTEQGV